MRFLAISRRRLLQSVFGVAALFIHSSCDRPENDYLRLAAMTPATRQAEWPEDVIVREGPRLKSMLPDVSTIDAIWIRMSDEDMNEVRFDIPKSQWPRFIGFLDDSQPITFETEMLVLARVNIEVVNGDPHSFLVLSYGANPVIFQLDLGYASNKSELEVLEYIEQFQVKQPRRRFRGWYERP